MMVTKLDKFKKKRVTKSYSTKDNYRSSNSFLDGEISDPDEIEEEENDEDYRESMYSNSYKRKKTNKKNLVLSNFIAPLQHNHLLDTDESDSEIFPDVNNKTYDSDSIFTKSDFSTNHTIDDEDIHIDHKLITNPTPQQPPAKKRKTLQIRKSNKQREMHTIQDNSIPVNVLPEKYRSLFKFPSFNKMQSMAFDSIYHSNNNCIVSSPTGSGKTVLFELAIINLMKNLSEFDINNLKILYIAPTKSLCTEILKKWESCFLDLKVGMFTGDTTYKESDNIKKSNIIITTPEKWDLLTRKWDDHSKLFHLVRLIMIDEIHTIGEARGATLEVILTRMNILCNNIRFIAASATIPNICDIAQWLKSNNGEPAQTLTFDDEFRQVSLEKHVYGYPSFNTKNEFQKDAFYNSKLSEIILRHYKQKPVLIFCPTRSSTISTAKYLCKNFPVNFTSNSKDGCLKINDNTLKECVTRGIAFHNAGLSLEDRTTVEQNFINGKIKILCSTSTLAVGVNLPAYLAIIKGTSIWNIHENKDYSNLDILQMIGRAGRPQFENEGCAIIITDSTKKEHFENLLDGNDMLESTLHLNLYEHLCSEISLRTITSPDDAIKWLRCTFLYVRYEKNPNFYYQIRNAVNRQEDMDSQLVSFCITLINELVSENLVENVDSKFICSVYGKAMVRHYILFGTMKTFINAGKKLSTEDVLTLLVKSQEFKELRIRHNEKRFFKEINMSPLIRSPFLTEKKQSKIIDQTFQKISLLLQYELGGLEFPLFEWSFKIRASLIQEKLLVFRHSQRLLKCMIDTFIQKKDGISLKNALFLLRSINANAWEDSTGILRQLKLIGLVAHRKLVNQNVSSLEDIAALTEEQIEYYLGLKIGLGFKIKDDLSLLPKLNIRMKPDKCVMLENHTIEVILKVEISAEFKSVMWHGKYLSIDCETINNNGTMLDFRRVLLKQLKSPKSFRIKSVIDSCQCKITLLLNCQEVAGIGKTVEFSFDDLGTKYQDHVKTSQTFTALNKCLFVDEEFSDHLSSDDSILEYLNNEKKNVAFNIMDGKERVLKNSNTNVKSNNNNNMKSGVSGTTSRDVPEHTERRLLPNGNYECNHFCKDKTRCRHYCCKDGVPINLLKSGAHTKTNGTKEVRGSTFSEEQLQQYRRDDSEQIDGGSKTIRDKEQGMKVARSPLQHPTVEEINIYSDDENSDEDQDMSRGDVLSSYRNSPSCLDNHLNPVNLSNSTISYVSHQPARTQPVTRLTEKTADDTSSSQGEDIIHRFLGSDVEIN